MLVRQNLVVMVAGGHEFSETGRATWRSAVLSIHSEALEILGRWHTFQLWLLLRGVGWNAPVAQMRRDMIIALTMLIETWRGCLSRREILTMFASVGVTPTMMESAAGLAMESLRGVVGQATMKTTLGRSGVLG